MAVNTEFVRIDLVEKTKWDDIEKVAENEKGVDDLVKIKTELETLAGKATELEALAEKATELLALLTPQT